jgi:hypothetical protein
MEWIRAGCMTRSGLRLKEQPGFSLFFGASLVFNGAVAMLQRFSLSSVTGGILTHEKFFRRGTLETAMRNAFQHNGWEKILARTPYLVHDPPRHPLYLVFIVRLVHSPVSL